MKIKLMLAAALLMVLAIGGTVSKAHAGSCHTTCYGSSTYQTCNTYCY